MADSQAPMDVSRREITPQRRLEGLPALGCPALRAVASLRSLRPPSSVLPIRGSCNVARPHAGLPAAAAGAHRRRHCADHPCCFCLPRRWSSHSSRRRRRARARPRASGLRSRSGTRWPCESGCCMASLGGIAPRAALPQLGAGPWSTSGTTSCLRLVVYVDVKASCIDSSCRLQPSTFQSGSPPSAPAFLSRASPPFHLTLPGPAPRPLQVVLGHLHRHVRHLP